MTAKDTAANAKQVNCTNLSEIMSDTYSMSICIYLFSNRCVQERLARMAMERELMADMAKSAVACIHDVHSAADD